MIVAVPLPIPETIPDKEPTVATELLLLVHVPPGAMLLSVIELPVHTVELPVIGAIAGIIVMVLVAGQVPVIEIVAMPEDKPQTIPVALIVAIGGLLIPQTPPPIKSVSVTHEPAHTEFGPNMTPGEIGGGITLTVVVVKQPVDSVYVMVSSPIAVSGVTMPETEPINAIPVLLLLQIPPEALSCNVVAPNG